MEKQITELEKKLAAVSILKIQLMSNSIKEVAEKFWIASATLQKINSGESSITIKQAQKVMDVLEVKI